MEQIKVIAKRAFFLLALLTNLSCHAQKDKDTGSLSIYGKWICVDADYRGYQKFSSEQAAQLKHSVLNIEPNKIFYSGISFVNVCSFYSLTENKNIDVDAIDGTSLTFRYTKEELSKLIEFDPVDEHGETPQSCFNDCSQFYLKQDTLINICGGYTLLFVRSFDFKGTGGFTKELSFPKSVTSIAVHYEFYKEPDELTISDQNGKVLYGTGMKITSKKEVEKIKLDSSNKLVFRIESKEPTSRWTFSVEI